MDEKISAWRKEAKERNVSMLCPRHQFRSVGSRNEDELCAIAYAILVQVDELLESGRLKINSKPQGSIDIFFEED